MAHSEPWQKHFAKKADINKKKKPVVEKGGIIGLEYADLLAKSAIELSDKELLQVYSLANKSGLDAEVYRFEIHRRILEKQLKQSSKQTIISIFQVIFAIGLIVATIGLVLATNDLSKVTEETAYLHPRLEAVFERDLTKDGKLITSSVNDKVEGIIRVYNTGQQPLILQIPARKPNFDVYLNCLGGNIKGDFSEPTGNQYIKGVEGKLLKSGEFKAFHFEIEKQNLDVTNDCNVSGKISTSQSAVFAEFFVDIEAT